MNPLKSKQGNPTVNKKLYTILVKEHDLVKFLQKIASRVSPRALRALRPAGFPHTRPAATFSKKSQKNAIFFTQKGHPAPQKLKFCMKNIVFFYSKRPPSLAKN